MGNLRELSPYAARDAAGFVESMKQLKKLSGLTYRELEEQAARNGEVLARSTLADVLRRPGLPRPEVLAAFVRACGDGERVDAWLEARERIAAAGPRPVPAEPADPPPDSPPDSPSPSPEEPAPQRRDHRLLTVIASALALPLLAVGVWGLLPDGPGTDTERTPTDGWVTIRPAGETDLCLTDGRDRAGAYGSAVAVHLPCAQAPVPRTYLEPAGEGRYRVQWHHPEMGKGCLTVMDGGPVKGMIEPRDDCTGATLFRVEPAPDGSGFRFRTERHGQCVGTAGRDAAEGVEAVQEPCADTRDQYFVVRGD